MEYKDYYQIMGIERDASAADIKQAYRRLAHQYHPDISSDPKGKEKFQEIGAAYAVLKDPEKRQAYDTLGQRTEGESFTPPPQWQQQFHTDAAGFEDVDLADLLAALARARAHPGRPGPQRGQDFELSAPVTLEQIHTGAAIEVHAQLPEHDSHGLVHRVARSFQVTIPRGAANGQRLRLAGQGGAGIGGGPAGDLYIALVLRPHPLFRIEGKDLHMDLPLAPWEAVLGARIRLPTLGGPVDLEVKPGTLAGQRLRLGGRGLAAADGGTGALFALVRIVLPGAVTPAEQDLYRQLAAQTHFDPRPHFGDAR